MVQRIHRYLAIFTFCYLGKFDYIYIMKENIKTIARQITRMSSDDINDLASELMENGISATLYRFSPLASVWDMHTPNVCNIYLRTTGNRKLLLVKVIKEQFGLGLREAKNLVDDAPCFLKKNVDYEKAEDIVKAINETDAYALIKESND